MAYALAIDRPIESAVKQLMIEQLDRIEAHLRAGEIHDARKRTKETRALLRMVRDPLGQLFDAENRWYRDVARELSEARDRETIVEALRRLVRQTDDREILTRLRKERDRRARRRRPSRKLQATIEALIAGLPEARERLEQWPKLDDDFATIGDSIERTFRAGRRALPRASEDRAPEHFHELRKRVKDHWYHSQLLRPVWPAVMKGYAAGVERLSDLLGEQHDLVVTAGVIDDAVLQAFIVMQRTKLEKEALTEAWLVFSESPRAWRKRIGGYWNAARSG